MSQPNYGTTDDKSASTGPAPVANMDQNTRSNDASQQQYEIVKVRKPDGTIAEVRRPITAEESTKLASAWPKSQPAFVTQTSASTTTASWTITKSGNAAENLMKESQKIVGSNVATKTEEVVNTTAKGVRFYKGLDKLHKGSSRLANAFASELDASDQQDGDEEYDEYSSDDDDDRRNDSDDKHRANNNRAQNGAGMNTNAGAPKTTNAQPGNDEKTAKSTINAKTKNATLIDEKEVPASESETSSLKKPATPNTEGKNLKIRYKDWSRYVIWSIMIVFPLLFIAVGILVAVRNGDSADVSIGNATDQALEVAVSVWPIIFAGIVAQSLRAYATYRVERGVRLMTLEQLVNSHSVASSIKQPFLLRRFNAITIALLMLWGLSPLATQAMQRVSYTVSTYEPHNVTEVRFVNTAVNNSNYLSADAGIFSDVQAEFNRLYPASFLPQNVAYGSDPYGNALIPIFTAANDEGGWQNTDPSESFKASYTTYASAYGVPIASSDILGDVSAEAYYASDDSSMFNITIQAAYLDGFNCNPWQITSFDELLNNSNIQGGSSSTLFINMTAMSGDTKGTIFFASAITTGANVDITNSSNINYGYTNCSFSQTFVNASISCQSSGCYTYKVKKSNETSGFVFFGADNFASGILDTSGSTNWTHSIATDTEKYLMTETGSIVGAPDKINITTVDPITFAQNLAFLMNTFWSIGFAPTNLTSALSSDTSYPFNKDLVSPVYSTTGTLLKTYNQYGTDWAWLAALMVCSTFLLLAGIFSIWWDSRTISPDLLGFASTVVRKSKYVNVPPVKSTASGAERARALGDVRVMMQDVKPNAEVGRIALGTAHPYAKRLQPGRSYR